MKLKKSYFKTQKGVLGASEIMYLPHLKVITDGCVMALTDYFKFDFKAVTKDETYYKESLLQQMIKCHTGNSRELVELNDVFNAGIYEVNTECNNRQYKIESMYTNKPCDVLCIDNDYYKNFIEPLLNDGVQFETYRYFNNWQLADKDYMATHSRTPFTHAIFGYKNNELILILMPIQIDNESIIE